MNRPLTLPEAATSLGVSPKTLRHQIALGRFNAFKVGRDWLVDTAAVEEYRATRLRVISSDGSPERIVPVEVEQDGAA